MTALSDAFKPKGWLLSAAISVSKTILDQGYDFPALQSRVDFFNVMAYDMHGPWEDTTDNHAPLYRRAFEEENSTLNIDYIINYYIQQQLPKEKINLGIPVYGQTWTLSSTNTDVGASAYGAGHAGPITNSSGILAYSEICSYIKNNGWTVVQDPNKQTGPYAYSPDPVNKTWVGYDDIEMVKIKAEYATNLGLGGVMVWEMSQDDFGNHCNQGANPLIRAIYCSAINPDCDLLSTTQSTTQSATTTITQVASTVIPTTVPATTKSTTSPASTATTKPKSSTIQVTTIALTRGAMTSTEAGPAKSTTYFPPYRDGSIALKSAPASLILSLFLSSVIISIWTQ